MRAIIPSVLLAVAVLMASPAFAHWQWTKWGMARADVVAGAGGPLTPDGNVALVSATPVEVAGVRFTETRFVFDAEGRLERVVLRADERDYYRVQSALAQQLGEPVEADQYGKTYVDRAKGNTVRVSSDLGRTRLIYTRTPTDF